MSDLREELACLAHTQWSGWMKYLFKLSNTKLDGSVIIPTDFVQRWMRQVKTPYQELTKIEQDSDRKEADRAIEVVNHFIDTEPYKNYIKE